MPIHYDKTLKIARALVKRHEPTQEELKLARHMAQEGSSFEEIGIALKWTCAVNTIQNRLKKYNIFSRRRASGIGSKFSGNTYLNNSGCGMKNYRPKNSS